MELCNLNRLEMIYCDIHDSMSDMQLRLKVYVICFFLILYCNEEIIKTKTTTKNKIPRNVYFILHLLVVAEFGSVSLSFKKSILFLNLFSWCFNTSFMKRCCFLLVLLERAEISIIARATLWIFSNATQQNLLHFLLSDREHYSAKKSHSHEIITMMKGCIRSTIMFW